MRAMERAVLVVDEILVTVGDGGHSCEGFRCHYLAWYWSYVASCRERNPVSELSAILSRGPEPQRQQQCDPQRCLLGVMIDCCAHRVSLPPFSTMLQPGAGTLRALQQYRHRLRERAPRPRPGTSPTRGELDHLEEGLSHVAVRGVRRHPLRWKRWRKVTRSLLRWWFVARRDRAKHTGAG